MSGLRVAVHPGTVTTRVAAADPQPRLVAELAGSLPPEQAVRLLYADPPRPVVVGEGLTVAEAVGGAVPRIVVDAGASGTEVTLVTVDGAVRSRRLSAGGADCDAGLAALLGPLTPPEVRAYRERFSLHPAQQPPGGRGVGPVAVQAVLVARLRPVVDAVAELAHVVPPAEIVLVGGLARTPLLAELLDTLDLAPVRVPPDPAAAAVLGALGPGDGGQTGVASDGVVDDGPVGCAASGYGLPRDHGRMSEPAGVSGERAAIPAVRRLHLFHRHRPRPADPPRFIPAPRRGSRTLGRAALAVALAACLVAIPLMRSEPARPPEHAAELVQYGYRFALPAGWAHTGGLPELRRTVVTPERTPVGGALVSIERAELGYDAGAEPQRAAAELRAVYDGARARGERLDGYDPVAHVGGRMGTGYRQLQADAAVDWFVLFEGTSQLSVGCRHVGPAPDGVSAACAVVVGSLRLG